MSNRIEDIEVYNLAEAFSDKIWFIATKWEFFAKDTVGKQIVRSADSISANIAEGFGRFHYKENKNFCYFSRGSIIETKGWLKKAKTRDLLDDENYQLLLQQLETIHLKLNIYIKFIGKGKSD
ncbi:four helix bundle protein [Mucilaginibacter flavidus]|uniref:four helix bundle protein n=1 Tax=Mucilaginibacter flavidus TaxID=2949309 RepID=UPI0020921D8C|nr:four helix bundle protein [Mucilaginibacter flavidus]MCO5948711.1 four helix bundle protein [Mucilaginibacter flavidus]